MRKLAVIIKLSASAVSRSPHPAEFSAPAQLLMSAPISYDCATSPGVLPLPFLSFRLAPCLSSTLTPCSHPCIAEQCNREFPRIRSLASMIFGISQGTSNNCNSSDSVIVPVDTNRSITAGFARPPPRIL